MRFYKFLILFFVIFLTLISCKKENEASWKMEVKSPVQKVEIIDISKDFYDENFPLEDFKVKYPWFQGSVSDEDFAIRKKDKEEKKIYQDAIAKINTKKLQTDLQELFSNIKAYFPDFQAPKVYLYSSGLQSITEPIFYQPTENLVFVDISAFMGEGNTYYKGLENYYQKTMNTQNIVPKISLALAENFVEYSIDNQKFIDHIIYQGKLMILQDAFLPKTPNHLKINLTESQYEWDTTYEANIWNYFVENDLVFSDDARLVERFIAIGPFSKFYTEIDNESSPQVGIFIGWQICKAYLENTDNSLKNFLELDAETIFNQSKYNPTL